MILLDFYSGSHGHFLEYVINTWLFKGPRVPNIFTELGASHKIRKNPAYTKNRVVHANHYSEFDKPHDDPTQVIQITIDKHWANWIYQVNVLARAGDIPMEKKVTLTPDAVRSVPHVFRGEWYSKLNSEECGYNLPRRWNDYHVPVYKFQMESLFDLEDFYNELYQLAKFLNTTFVPDAELAALLNDFLKKNQGWQYYTECKEIYQNALAGKNIEFSSNEVSQALINSMVSKSIGVFDGCLFDDDTYPTNTSQLWAAIEHHLTTFDQRF